MKKAAKEVKQFPMPEGFELLTRFTVLGEPGRKSNQRRLVYNKSTGKPMFIRSEKALKYEEAFLGQVPEGSKGKYGSSEEPLALWAHIYYASNRPDLSVELITDLLQKSEVIANDRFLKCQVLFASVDKDNPRAEIGIYKIL